MPSVKLKICGMRDSKNILEVAAALPDYMGFIFYKDSPRYIGRDFSIPGDLNPGIEKVGVFVNEKVDTIMDLVAHHRLSLVQLHGDESPMQCQTLKDRGIGVIKVFSVDDGFDFSITDQYIAQVDYFLFDSKGKSRGGNGIAFNWNGLVKYKGTTPFFLSGGIDPENVKNIFELNHDQLFAVDVNSGIENAPGRKDLTKLNLLMKKLC